MNRKKLFIENIFAYGFINILNKLVPFLLLPIVTRMLPNTSDFGLYSMYTTIVGFGTPFAILGLYDAMFREYFELDDQKYRYNVTTTTQRIILCVSIFVTFILVLLSSQLSILLFNTAEYYHIFILAGLAVFISSNMSVVQAPTRMQNQRKVFIFSGLLSSVSMYVIAILLIYLGFSYFGLIYASIFSSVLLLAFFGYRNYHFFLKGTFDKHIAKKLLKIGLPLLPTSLIYWIYNSMDKIMIVSILDTTQLGIYSIGAKFSQISTLIYAAFAGGYQFFVFSTMKIKDQVQLSSKIFDFLGALSIASMIVVYPFITLGFNLLFEGDYVLGYIVVPYLFVAPLLLMLFNIIASQFIVAKKSYYATISLAFGAMLNVILNYFLINEIGIEGAAIATYIAYLATIVIAILISIKFDCMIYSKRIVLILLLGPIYILIQRIWIVNNFYLSILVMILFLIPFLYFYHNELQQIFKTIKNKVYR